MSQQMPSSQAQQTSGGQPEPKTQKYYTRIIVLLVIAFFSLLFLCIGLPVFFIHENNALAFALSYISIVLGVVGIILTFFFALIPSHDFQNRLQMFFETRCEQWPVATPFFALFLERNDYFISYVGADERWERWMSWQLQKEGYKIATSGKWNEGSYDAVLHNADRKAKHTITLLSQDFINELCLPEGPERWLQLLLKRNREHKDYTVRVKAIQNAPAALKAALRGTQNSDKRYRFPSLIDSSENDARKKLLEIIPSISPERKKNAPNPGPKPEFPPNAVWTIPDDMWKDKLFVGREKFLQELHDEVSKSYPLRKISPIAITGQTGVGKTRTAVRYAENRQNNYSHILYVDASTEETVRESLKTILKVGKSFSGDLCDTFKGWLGSTVSNSSTAQKPSSNSSTVQKSSIVGLLRGTVSNSATTQELPPNPEKYLLILDQCNDSSASLIQKLLPVEGNGSVLLTTHDEELAKNRFNIAQSRVKQLGDMREEQEKAARFLLRRSGKYAKDQVLLDSAYEKALAICEKCDYNPASIELAAKYISGNNISLDEYLRDVDKIQNLPAQWLSLIESLLGENEKAGLLLLLCAHLSSEEVAEIPIDILMGACDLESGLQALVADKKTFNELVAQAGKFGLLKRKDNCLTIPPLVQRTIHNNITRLGSAQDESAVRLKWVRNAVNIMSEKFPYVTHTNRAICEEYLKTAKICLDHIDRLHLQSMQAVRLLYLVGFYYMLIGSYKDAQTRLEQALNMSTASEDKIGDAGQFPNSATCNYGVAEIYRIQGEYKEAAPYYDKAKAALENLMKNDGKNVDKATVLNGLGCLYAEWGCLAEGEKSFSKALKLYEEEAKTPDVTYAICLSNRTSNLLHLQKQKGATVTKEAYENARTDYKTVEDILDAEKLDPTDPLRAHFHAQRAMFAVIEGRYYDAYLDYRASMKSSEKDTRDPQLAMRLSSQAVLSVKMRNFDEAKACFAEAFEIYKRFAALLLKSHPTESYALSMYGYLAREFPKDMDNHEMSRDAYKALKEQAQAIWEKHRAKNPAPCPMS